MCVFFIFFGGLRRVEGGRITPLPPPPNNAFLAAPQGGPRRGNRAEFCREPEENMSSKAHAACLSYPPPPTSPTHLLLRPFDGGRGGGVHFRFMETSRRLLSESWSVHSPFRCHCHSACHASFLQVDGIPFSALRQPPWFVEDNLRIKEIGVRLQKVLEIEIALMGINMKTKTETRLMLAV